ncbi:MAG: hypothetical protein V7695_04030 [Sulfitobacter sp.]
MIFSCINFQTQSLRHVVVFRLVMFFAGLVVLAGCVAPPVPVESDTSFRVSSVSVRIFQKDERSVPLKYHNSEEGRFPRADIGLSRAKVQADVKRALERNMIPTSKGGEREVRVQLTIYSLSLRGGGFRGHNSEYIQTVILGWVDFVDAQTGEVLVANNEFNVNLTEGMSLKEMIALTKTSSNVVREYNALVARVATVAPQYLP